MEGFQTVTSSNLVDIVNYNQLPDCSHRVIYLRFMNDYGKRILEFGSDFIEEEIVLKIVIVSSNSELLKLVNMIDISGSLRGDIFENRIHFIFQKVRS